jgi:hypothetical protein
MSMTPQIPQPKQLGAQRGYKPKKSIKAPSVQSAILAKRANGQSKNSIKKDLGLSYNTVTSVLDLNNFDEQFAKLRAESVGLVPKAIKVMHDRLDKGSENAAIVTLKETIWPLNGNNHRGMKPGDNLFVSIQNLIQPKPLESAIDVPIIPPKE